MIKCIKTLCETIVKNQVADNVVFVKGKEIG